MNKELVYLADLHSHTNCDIEDIDCKNIVQKSYSVLRQALTPPTADEVCKALSEQLKSTIITRKNKHGITFNYAETKKTIVSRNYDLLNIKVQLPPHLVTMIGKFYESLEEEK